MNVEKWRRWLTLAANVGVLAGIIFLAVEIRQNTLAVQATAIRDATILARQQILTLATNPDMARIDRVDDSNPAEQFNAGVASTG